MLAGPHWEPYSFASVGVQFQVLKREKARENIHMARPTQDTGEQARREREKTNNWFNLNGRTVGRKENGTPLRRNYPRPLWRTMSRIINQYYLSFFYMTLQCCCRWLLSAVVPIWRFLRGAPRHERNVLAYVLASWIALRQWSS